MSDRRSNLRSSQINGTEDTGNAGPADGAGELASAPISRVPRITPRNSTLDALAAEDTNGTPYETLRQLANIAPRPATPVHRSAAAGLPSARISARRTPGVTRTPNGVLPTGSTRKAAAATLYGQAARRRIEEQRTAALTPARNGRQSIRQQKDTPRDTLRLLSRMMAKDTEALPSSSPAFAEPSVSTSNSKVKLNDDIEDDFQLAPPRLSVPLGDNESEGEDDSYLIPPKRTPIPDLDDDDTQRSIEQPRRARNEHYGRLSRGSFGSVRTSGAFELGLEGELFDGDESTFIPANYDDEEDLIPDHDPTMPREFTENLRQPFFTQPFGRYSTASGRVSDVRPDDLLDETERSFAFDIPTERPLSGNSSPEAQLPHEIEGQVEPMDLQEDNDDADTDIDPDKGDLHSTGLMESTAKSVNDVLINSPVEKKRKTIKVSKHGIQYPSLPIGVVKKLATTFLRTSGNSKAKLNKDTLEAIMQASDWFLEQVSDDVGTYAKHAGRKTIDESDVVTLMRRQRQTNASTTPFALAQKYLPRELLQDLRMQPPVEARASKKRKVTTA